MMVSTSNKRVATATDSVATAQPMYDKAVKVAADADAIMARPEVKQLVVNKSLAEAMIKANSLYPNLYDSVKPYIPGFFRITALSASPIDDKSSTVNMTGTIKDARQYADLMLALLRIPGAVSVSRTGFQAEDVIVPPLVAVDNQGRPRLASKGPIPDDPIDRLAYFESDSVPSGFLNSGGFGETQEGTVKTVRPGESLITVSVTLPKSLQTPNPRATIQSLAGGAPAAAGNAAPGQPASQKTPPPAPGATAGGGGNKKKEDGD